MCLDSCWLVSSFCFSLFWVLSLSPFLASCSISNCVLRFYWHVPVIWYSAQSSTVLKLCCAKDELSASQERYSSQVFLVFCKDIMFNIYVNKYIDCTVYCADCTVNIHCDCVKFTCENFCMLTFCGSVLCGFLFLFCFNGIIWLFLSYHWVKMSWKDFFFVCAFFFSIFFFPFIHFLFFLFIFLPASSLLVLHFSFFLLNIWHAECVRFHSAIFSCDSLFWTISYLALSCQLLVINYPLHL